jgi:hypothetical protein
MTTKEQGSFCGSCAKIVVDFTKMKRNEIKQYFIEKKEDKTCGIFNVNQLTNNSNKSQSGRFLSKFAFALYVVFAMTLFSCGQNKTIARYNSLRPAVNYLLSRQLISVFIL